MSTATTGQRIGLVLGVFIGTVLTYYVLVGLVGMSADSATPGIVSFIIGLGLGLAAMKMLSAQTTTQR